MDPDTASPRLDLAVQRALGSASRALSPDTASIRRWASAALAGDAEVTVRLVGAREGRCLNRDYRGKDYATNVLTFVYGEGEALFAGVDEGPGAGAEVEAAPLVGDLVLCVPVVAREAAEQRKALEAHFAHLIVHGMLHLQGFDHEAADEAEEMESREAQILAMLGYANPYA
ncbi:MAG: rRNA maturation RNase YbeY [Aromatoleum sp.]|jgi:probable rRNA maturation factor|uniref:rRNA maturation RNase YbeY n=1 Tax=Aromatoleum sp. TaxID=2307007 RepID=UPI002893DED5|nr:rRNA maturation RNase YbeY [Aromatoleum sp.]MDT3670861.1 rRNA maturation RNase YbeY [Aromatoleum sp.]